MGSTSSHTSSGVRRRRLRPAPDTAIMRYAKAMLVGTPLLADYQEEGLEQFEGAED